MHYLFFDLPLQLHLQRGANSAMATWRGPRPPKAGASWCWGAQRATRRTVPCSCLTALNPSVIEAFVQADPYVQNGLVLRHTIVPWTTVVGEAAHTPVRPE